MNGAKLNTCPAAYAFFVAFNAMLCESQGTNRAHGYTSTAPGTFISVCSNHKSTINYKLYELLIVIKSYKKIYFFFPFRLKA